MPKKRLSRPLLIVFACLLSVAVVPLVHIATGSSAEYHRVGCRIVMSAPSATADRYTRTARFYDLYDLPMDLLGGVRRRRRRLLAQARGLVLEVGVGTGRNLGLYPAGVQIVGIDISPGMLDQARRRAGRSGTGRVSLQLCDTWCVSTVAQPTAPSGAGPD